ncbi:MAG: hypothetical protein AB1345_00330 [Chloroflexota bacterium]
MNNSEKLLEEGTGQADESDTLAKDTRDTQIKPTRFPRLKRGVALVLRWTLRFLVVFGLGVATVILALYYPARRQLILANQQASNLEAQLAQVSEQLSVSQARTNSLEADVESLQEELNTSDLHVTLLSALSDIIRARLALSINDFASARVYLASTPDLLEKLALSMGDEYLDVLSAMQVRLAQVLEEIESDTFAARSDLDVLANNLIQLEVECFLTNR